MTIFELARQKGNKIWKNLFLFLGRERLLCNV